MRNERAAEQARLFAFADRGAVVKCVVSGGLDGVEDGKSAAAEHLEIDAKAGVHHFRERHSFGEQQARAGNQIVHEIYVAVIEAAVDDVSFGEAIDGSGVQRDVDAALFEVARYVLPEIGELQSGAGRVGEELSLFIAIAAEIEDEASNRIGGVGAVIKDSGPGGVTLYGLILTKGLEEIGKRLLGDFLRGDSFLQRDENRMRRAPFVAGASFMLPPVEQVAGALRV